MDHYFAGLLIGLFGGFFLGIVAGVELQDHYGIKETIMTPVEELAVLKSKIKLFAAQLRTDGDYTQASSLEKLLSPESVKVIYTVPLHVGENVEVPSYAKVTYYDPAERS